MALWPRHTQPETEKNQLYLIEHEQLLHKNPSKRITVGIITVGRKLLITFITFLPGDSMKNSFI